MDEEKRQRGKGKVKWELSMGKSEKCFWNMIKKIFVKGIMETSKNKRRKKLIKEHERLKYEFSQ